MSPRKLAVIPICFLAASACVAPVVPGKGISKPKGDESKQVDAHGEVSWSREMREVLEPGVADEWTFVLTAAAEVKVSTSSVAEDLASRPEAEAVDTVIYVRDDASGKTEENDDAESSRWSSLTLTFPAGSYTVGVRGYNDEAVGAYALTATKADADVWALAKDVHLHTVKFTDATPIPADWIAPEATDPMGLSGPEWWQRWPEGHRQSFSYEHGTDYGKRCGSAASIRLQAIWEHPDGRKAFETLIEASNWDGWMFNWIEDISQGNSMGQFTDSATMWAWETHSTKWITVVRPDGSCDLPTLELVQEYSTACSTHAENTDGEIKGCIARTR